MGRTGNAGSKGEREGKEAEGQGVLTASLPIAQVAWAPSLTRAGHARGVRYERQTSGIFSHGVHSDHSVSVMWIAGVDWKAMGKDRSLADRRYPGGFFL